MKRIENVEQARAEIKRLKVVAKQQEQQLRNDLKEIREDFKPENILWNTVSSLTGVNVNRHDFFKDGIAYGLSLIVQRFILKTERKIENKAFEFVESIFERVKSIVTKFISTESRREERKEEKEDFIPGE